MSGAEGGGDIPTARHSFLGGGLMLEQPLSGYRAGMDAALVAAAAAALPGGHCIEVGCGVGAALLSVAARRPDMLLTGIEKSAGHCAIAARNIAANGLSGRACVICADGLGPALHVGSRNAVVFANPPYFDDSRSIREPRPDRRHAWIAEAALEDWIRAMTRLAGPKGHLALIHRADRLADILQALEGRAGDARVFPVRPFPDAPAKRVVVTARRGTRGPTELMKGLDLHPAHGVQAFTDAAQAVFDGGPLAG